MKFYRITEILEKYVNRENIPDWRWDAAGDRGSRLHDFIKNYLKGIWIASVDLDVEPYFDSFVAWAEEMIDSTLLVEKELKCPTYGIIGHVDWVGILKIHQDAITVIDWKSPVSEGNTWKCQVSTYDYLLAKYGPFPNSVQYCGALQLDPKGKTARLLDYTKEKQMSFNVFLQALNAHRWLNP